MNKNEASLKTEFGDGPWFFLCFTNDAPIRLTAAAFCPPDGFEKAWKVLEFSEGEWNKNVRVKAFSIFLLVAAAKSRSARDEKKINLAKGEDKTWLSGYASIQHDRHVSWWEGLVFRYPTNAGENSEMVNTALGCLGVSRTTTGPKFQAWIDSKKLNGSKIFVYRAKTNGILPPSRASQITKPTILLEMAALVENHTKWNKQLRDHLPDVKRARRKANTTRSAKTPGVALNPSYSNTHSSPPASVLGDRKALPLDGTSDEGVKKHSESEEPKLPRKISSEKPLGNATKFQTSNSLEQAQPDQGQAEMDDPDIYNVPQFVDLANRATKKFDLLNLIAASTSVSVAGLSGSGKSFLVASFLNGHSRFKVKGAVIWHDPDQSGDESLEALIEKLGRPMRLHGKSLLERCKQLMRLLETNNQILIIDDFHSVNKRSYSTLIEAASRLRPPARLVLISQTNIGMTADIPDVPHLDVSGFDEHELRRFLIQKKINISDDNLVKEILLKTDGLPIAADWFAHMVNSLKRDPEQLLGGTMTTSARLQSWFNDVVTNIGEPAWNVLRMLSLCDGPFNEGVVRILCQHAGSESFEKLFEALQRAYLVQSYSPFRWRLHHLIVDFSRLGMLPEFAERIHSVLGNYHWKKSQWMAKGLYAEEALLWQAKACRHFQNARDFERSSKTVHRMIKETKSRGFIWLIIRLLGDELEMNPSKDGWLGYHYAHCCLIVGRYRQCLAVIKPLANQPLLDDPDLKVSSVRIYANLLDEMGRPRFALEDLQKLLDSDVVKSANRIVVGQAKALRVKLLTRLKMYDRAEMLSEELFIESVSDKIAKAIALAGWGVVLECKGQYQLADEKLGQAVNLFVNKDYRGLGWSLSHQAVCQMKMNHPAGASLMLEEALKIKSDIDEASEEYLAFLHMVQPLLWERGLPNLIKTEIQRVSTRIRGFEK